MQRSTAFLVSAVVAQLWINVLEMHDGDHGLESELRIII